jgi:hypothetical protein
MGWCPFGAGKGGIADLRFEKGAGGGKGFVRRIRDGNGFSWVDPALKRWAIFVKSLRDQCWHLKLKGAPKIPGGHAAMWSPALA